MNQKHIRNHRFALAGQRRKALAGKYGESEFRIKRKAAIEKSKKEAKSAPKKEVKKVVEKKEKDTKGKKEKK